MHDHKWATARGSSQRSSATTLSDTVDRRSIMSASSGGTLVEGSMKTVHTTVSGNLRKFTSGVGKPGQAREVREAVRTVVGHANPMRKSPISKPVDYENVISQNSLLLENDSQRELLLFPRDDFTETVIDPEEEPQPSISRPEDANWLLAQEALQFYNAKQHVITFHYSRFGGDYVPAKNENETDLAPLLYELDLIAEEEKTAVDGTPTAEIIREGYLLVVPDSGLLDNFKSAKRRYCVFRRESDGQIMLEIQKTPGMPNRKHPAIAVQRVSLNNKKGKTVIEVIPSVTSKTLILTAEVENELSNWLIDVQRALNPSTTEDRSTSNSLSGTAGETDSIASDDNSMGRGGNRGTDDSTAWKGRNAAAKALQPPIVNRRSLFELYAGLETLPKPIGEASCLMCPDEEWSSSTTKTTTECIRFDDADFTRFLVEYKELNLRLPTTSGAVLQVEPFFVRMFFFDAKAARRISEEFRMVINGDSQSSMTKECNGGMHGLQVANIKSYKMIASIDRNSRNVFLVIRLERMLTGDTSAEAYMRPVGDSKMTIKLQKHVAAAGSRLATYRTPFAWTMRPLYGADANETIGLYRSDPNKTTDADVQKAIFDMTKSEKANKSQIPNASITVRIDNLSKFGDHLMPSPRLSPSYLPIRQPGPTKSTELPIFELQSFADQSTKPYRAYTNLLFVYPISLRYENQKVFPKARNIVCNCRLMLGNGNTTGVEPSKAIFDRTGADNSFFAMVGRSSVQHHEQNPVFNDEIKLQLPIALTSNDHLLFSFGHVAVAAAVNPKSPVESVESPIGYAWLPLLKKDRLILDNDEQEFELKVVADLPPGYLQSENFGLGKGHSGAELRYIDNGKKLFRIRIRLVSTVFTSEAKLQGFFQACKRLQRIGAAGDAADGTKPPVNLHPTRSCSPILMHQVSTTVNQSDPVDDYENVERKLCSTAEDLMTVEMDRLLPFLPVLLNRLLKLSSTCSSDAMALTTLKALVMIVNKAYLLPGGRDLLRRFVSHQFNGVQTSTDVDEGSLLCRHLSALVRQADGNSQPSIGSILKKIWFLLDVTAKSIALRLIRTNLYKAPRKERCSAELLENLQCLVEAIVPILIARHRELPDECRQANVALAYFFRVCLSLIDRGAVFRWLHFVVDQMDRCEAKAIRDFKLEMLQIMTGHEHWLPLSLPLVFNQNGSVMRKNSAFADPLSVSSQASQNNSGFLARLFSQYSQYFGPTSQSNQTNDHAPLTDCMHEFSLTAAFCERHFLVGLLHQEVNAGLREPRDYRKRIMALLRNLLAKHSSDKRYLDAEAQGRIATLYIQFVQIAISQLYELDLAVTYGESSPDHSPMHTANTMAMQQRRMLTMSMERGGSISTATVSVLGDSSRTTATLRNATTLPLPTVASPNFNPGFVEKFDKFEIRDVMLCVLYILQRLPKRILGAMWHQETAQCDLIRLLELGLNVFAYRGRKKAKNAPSTSTHAASLASITCSLSKSSNRNSLGLDLIDEQEESLPFSILQELNLTQEVGLIVLETAQALSEHLIIRSGKQADAVQNHDSFHRILRVHLSLLRVNWPETVRLHSLTALAVFIVKFRGLFFQSGPLDALSELIEALLLQLNSRLQRVQHAAAALLQLVLRNGYDVYVACGKAAPSASSGHQHRSSDLTEQLGRPGAQTGVALARLLGHKQLQAASLRFQRGLLALEAFVTNGSTHTRITVFDRAVQELIHQLRGVLSATGALTDAAKDPEKLADLHVQLANSYRGSAALRAAWFDTLSEAHMAERWYSEAAVCQGHTLAIMAKELVTAGELKVDWSLLDNLSESIGLEEQVGNDQMNTTQRAGYTLENFTERVEAVVRTLLLSERYEAVGPLCRLAMPVLEQQQNFVGLVGMYAELQQAYSRASEVKASGKRRLATYFRVTFHGVRHFGEQHGVEWIYREPGLTSLAEASERMASACRAHLGYDRVQVIAAETLDDTALNDETIAYVQMTHVSPLLSPGNGLLIVEESDFYLHTNVTRFAYEASLIDDSVPVDAPLTARQARRRVCLTTAMGFPSARRRQKVIARSHVLLNPLEVACAELHRKAQQLRCVLAASRLDVKRLQLLLQGAVQPTVNAGPLSYAEVFTAPSQRDRYGEQGVTQLAEAFRNLVDECCRALRANQRSIGPDQLEYQAMLQNAFDAMLERLQGYFGGTFFPNEQMNGIDGATIGDPNLQTAMHIFDSIGGINV